MAVYLLGRWFVQINLIKLTRGIVFDFRVELIEKIFLTSYQKFEKMDRGRVYTALNDDVDTIGNSTNMLVMLITSVVTAVGAFLYLASIAFWATILTLCLMTTMALLYYFVSRSTNKFYDDARDSTTVFMRLINSMIDGFKEISLHRNKKIAFKSDVEMTANEYRQKISTADIRFTNAFLVGESLLVLLLGTNAFVVPKLFPGIQLHIVMSFVIVLLYLIGPINGILNSAPAILQLKVAWNRVQQFLKEIPASVELPLSKPVKGTIHNFSASNIAFQYRDSNDQNVFMIGPIDIELKSGEILFIIGGNGSGKTTLAKLLTGLYELDKGTIKINGVVVEGTQLSEYFSAVFNPSHLFEKLYNIDVENRYDEVNKYLKMLDLDEKVEISENKYSTINLSGGQRKRLALLQCYLEDCPIYLFDEWAADQDPGYRSFFYRTLLPEMKRSGKIVIAITHDDHYFDVADKVLKMEQGKVFLHTEK
jgi:putative pyoverdin transport system ATP-binding/permease protein